MNSGIVVRPAGDQDSVAVWRVLEPVIRAGETYALPADMSETAALQFWFGNALETFIALIDEHAAGTYYLKANQQGGGGHVANCGYVTDARYAGRGLARAMCLHSISRARDLGFTAMQFNLVVSSNVHAVHLWKSLGFGIVGTLPGAFVHPVQGAVDAFVMYRKL